MKIIKIGDFDKRGDFINWHLDGSNAPCGFEAATCKNVPHCIGLLTDPNDPSCPVTVNGVEIVEWTKKRRLAMTSR